MGKRPKGQRKKAIRERRRLTHQQATAEGNHKSTISKILKRIFQTLSVLGLLLGIGVGILSLLPKIHVSSSASLNPTNPFATPFIISNEGYLSIYDIKYSCALYEFKYEQGRILRPETKRGVRFSTPELAAPELAPGNSTTIFCPVPASNIGRLGAMKHGDIAIVVSYRPAFLWWRQEHWQRFSTLKSIDGMLYWHPQTE